MSSVFDVFQLIDVLFYNQQCLGYATFQNYTVKTGKCMFGIFENLLELLSKSQAKIHLYFYYCQSSVTHSL